MYSNNRSIEDLPVPDAAGLAHSEKLAGHIRALIAQAGGSISFAEFMQEALYAPELGYYVAGSARFGPGGDFVTAPEIGPLFGRVLARQCAAVLQRSSNGAVLELGAGSGRLAVEILRFLRANGIELQRYLILEVSPDLIAQQQRLIRAQVPELMPKVEWLDRMPQQFRGVVIANEVADALPVERFSMSGREVVQLRVGWEQNAFAWHRAAAPRFLAEAVLHIEATIGRQLANGFVSEVSSGLAKWVDDIAACVESGFVFLFDYGLPRREYYAPDRRDGWLRCHLRHRAHNDPLIYPGLQDLTAWVDFTAVAEAASGAGMDIAGFVSQAQFLLNGGLSEELADFDRLPTASQIDLSRQVKILTLPDEMGENFKCMGLARGDMPTLSSFANQDRTHIL
jgi:SAM-dependent MidA family methyltransferase